MFASNTMFTTEKRNGEIETKGKRSTCARQIRIAVSYASVRTASRNESCRWQRHMCNEQFNERYIRREEGTGET